MTVYATAQLKIHNRERYDRYQAGFLATMEGIDMQVLAADEAVDVVEGDWSGDRFVLLSFKDEVNFRRWLNSDAYQAIIKDRTSSADGPVLLVHGLT